MRSEWAPACRARRKWQGLPKRCLVVRRADCRICRIYRPECLDLSNFPAHRVRYRDLAARKARDCRVLAAFRASARRNNDVASIVKKGRQMSLKIRMARAGTKKRPVYHIVVADSRSPRDGRFIERLGYFNPLLPKDNADRLKFDIEKAKSWLAKGATPSHRILRFLDAAGVRKRPARNNPERALPRKERKARAEAAAKAAASAPKPAPKPAA